MLSKFSVKKPFTVLVGVVLILVLGFVSLSKMQTDLLPAMSLPYLMVITTYPGASPEKVQDEVTGPLESALGTVNGNAVGILATEKDSLCHTCVAKAARFVRLCDAYSLPIVTIVNTTGFVKSESDD